MIGGAMMKKILCFLLIGVICMGIGGCDYPLYNLILDKPSKKRTLTPEEYLPLAEIAIKKIQEINPNFQANAEDCFVSKSKSKNSWYAYVYSIIDKAYGYEVYCDNGTYTVNFDNALYEARISFVEKLNELRPDNKELNSYIHFAPFGTNYRTVQLSSGIHDGVLHYSVATENLNLDEELSIDYEMLIFYKGVMDELGLDFNGISVHYFIGNCPEIKIPRNNYYFGKVTRDSYLNFAEGNEDFNIPHILTKAGRYLISLRYDGTKEDIERITDSKEAFIEYAKKNWVEKNKT